MGDIEHDKLGRDAGAETGVAIPTGDATGRFVDKLNIRLPGKPGVVL